MECVGNTSETPFTRRAMEEVREANERVEVANEENCSATLGFILRTGAMGSINTSCGSGVGVLRGGGKVAVVGGRSGSFSLRVSYEGRRGAMRDSGLRSAEGRKLYSRW